jgi:hypothetical protein
MMRIDDKTLYTMTRNVGLADSQYHYSRFIGRSNGYFSCIATRRLKVSITALGILAARIEQQMRDVEHGERRQQLKALHSIVMEEMRNRCAERAGV